MSHNSPDGRIKDLKKRFGEEIRIMGERKTPNSPALGPRPKPQLPLSDMPSMAIMRTSEADLKLREMSGRLIINGIEYRSQIIDLQKLGELGSGTYGDVVKMLHKPSGAVIAVKQMRRSGDPEENKRILMDLEIVRSHRCPFIVKCLGFFVTDAVVWICMELMASCFDKLLKRLGAPIPERILGKVTVATVNALSYLKDVHRVIHRDVKPSNILLDEQGNIKLCDFGISGKLVESRAKTRAAGCVAYMAPERIEPPDPSKPDYDIRADVWSLGISLVELATGMFPYKGCTTDFEVLTKVLNEEPPRLPDTADFSPEFKTFVQQCLTKNYRQRPKYTNLLEHPFLVRWTHTDVDVASWYGLINSHEPASSLRETTTSSLRPIEPTLKTVEVSPTPLRRTCNDVDSGIATPPNLVFQPRLDAPVTDWRAPRLTSISQPTSLEAARENYSPYLRRRSADKSISPPPLSRTPEARRRPSPVTSSNTSPLLLQRYYHQSQQRRSRADLTGSQQRFRSLSNDTAGRSPEPPPRRNVGLYVNAAQERLHSPIQQRLMGGRSNSLTRAELANGWSSYGDSLPQALHERLARDNLRHERLVRDNLHFNSPHKSYINGLRDNPIHERENNTSHREVTLQERLSRDDRLPQPQRSHGQKHHGDQGAPPAAAPSSPQLPHPSQRATPTHAPKEMLAASSPPTRWGGESWSVPASPRPPRAPRPAIDNN